MNEHQLPGGDWLGRLKKQLLKVQQMVPPENQELHAKLNYLIGATEEIRREGKETNQKVTQIQLKLTGMEKDVQANSNAIEREEKSRREAQNRAFAVIERVDKDLEDHEKDNNRHIDRRMHASPANGSEIVQMDGGWKEKGMWAGAGTLISGILYGIYQFIMNLVSGGGNP